MKTLFVISLLFLLTNCAGGNVAKVSFGKKCTALDSKKLQEASYIWFVSKDAVREFDKRINKSNCLKS